jgi:hypothetical protein
MNSCTSSIVNPYYNSEDNSSISIVGLYQQELVKLLQKKQQITNDIKQKSKNKKFFVFKLKKVLLQIIQLKKLKALNVKQPSHIDSMCLTLLILFKYYLKKKKRFNKQTNKSC